MADERYIIKDGVGNYLLNFGINNYSSSFCADALHHFVPGDVFKNGNNFNIIPSCNPEFFKEVELGYRNLETRLDFVEKVLSSVEKAIKGN